MEPTADGETVVQGSCDLEETANQTEAPRLLEPTEEETQEITYTTVDSIGLRKHAKKKKEKESAEIARAKEKVTKVKVQIDAFLDQMFESKLKQVQQNEQMIGSYKFQPRMKNAEHKYNVIKAKVNEQKEKMTT